MIECYCSWCYHHSVDEPFCSQNECLANDLQLACDELILFWQRADRSPQDWATLNTLIENIQKER
jgi:hypothetical protein